jgi:hypothetical protein
MKRIYGIEVDNVEENFDYITCSDEQFIEESESQGLVWEDLNIFIDQLNKEEINVSVTQFRVI